jgi:dipeptidyl aminopeptidase/acylaminoacyl peptidase
MSFPTFFRSVAGVLAAALFALSAQANAPLPVDNWAIRHGISTVALSPNGQHILVLKLESKKGKNILEIYDVDDFAKPLRRLNAKPMEFISARWVNDNYVVGTAWRVVRKSVGGPEEDVRSYKLYSYNLENNSFSEASGSFSIVNNLPNDPDNVLVQVGTAVSGGLGVDPFAAFRPRSYYKFNLKTGTKKLVLKGSEKYPQAVFDLDGNPRFTQSAERGTNILKSYYRKPGDSSWTQFGEEYDFDSHENLYRILSGIHGYVGSKHDDPDIGYIIDNRDSDKAGLWEFHFSTGKFGRKLFETPEADVTGVQRHSMSWAGNNKLVAAIYSGAKRERHWFDPEEKALYQQFEQAIPHAHQISITGRSRDGQTLVVFNSGPRDPGSYWLVRDGKMAKLGSRNPTVTADNLSDVEFVKYKARDGLTIPAYMTRPEGDGPFPTIILPHGGPHVNEVIGYDEWGQLLANNGYLVLQPQYRMSTGWGQKHFDSAYGQHGLAMQDDKDDGARYLIERGLADPDRIAMFGWSYGGYAALVAASREPNLYQCVIAGAAVADARKVYLKRSRGSAPKAMEEWAKARGGYVGINPIDEVEKINIPILMVHGDVDARVLYFNMKDYKRAYEEAFASRQSGRCSGGLEDGECTVTLFRSSGSSADSVLPAAMPVQQAAAKTGDGKRTSYTAKSRFLTLKGADHFSRTLMYDHQHKFYTELLDYLENDCGPGGL